MRLLTKELETQFEEHSIANLETDLQKSKILVRYYNSTGRGNWLVVAAEAVQDSWLLYGYFSVNGIHWAWSTYPLKELESDQNILADFDTIKGESIATYFEKFLLDSSTASFTQYCLSAELYCTKIASLSHFQQIYPCENAKCNKVLYGLVFVKDSVGIAVYLEAFYKDFIDSNMNFLDHVNYLVEYTLSEFDKVPAIIKNNAIPTLELNSVYPVLINTDLNRSLLEDVLHRDIADLSIIYKINIGSYNDATLTIKINNAIAEEYGWTEEMLYEASLKSLNPMTDYTCGTLQEIFPKVFEDIKLPEDCETKLYVITNRESTLGAFGIFSEEFCKLSNSLGEDLVLLPSSIHEYLAIEMSRATENLEGLRMMVNTINKEIVSTADFLSNNIYHYHRETKTITIL